MAQIIRSAEIDAQPVVITYRSPVAEPPAAVVPQIEPALAAMPPFAQDIAPLPQLAEPVPEAPPAPSPEERGRQAAEEGYRDGYDAGVQRAKAELADTLEALQGFGRSVREALAHGVEGLEDVMVEIAFAAVCKLLGQAALTEEGVRSMVREAMHEARSKEGIVLRISPRDYALLHAAGAVARPIVDDAKVEVVADDRVASGCLVETSGGTLDARLEVQMRQLLDTLTRARDAVAE